MKKIVFQTIDSPRRDLEWRVYMALKLSQAGISCAIGNVRQINYLLEKSKNCIYLGRLGGASGRTAFDRRTLNVMQKNKTSMFFLHDEGAFYTTSGYEDSVRRVYPENLFRLAPFEKILFWGEKQKKVYENHKEKAKFLVTGAPRFDLCRPDYTCLDTVAISELKNKYKDFVLVNCRFAPVNMVPDDPSYIGKRSLEIRLEASGSGDSKKDAILSTMFKEWEKHSIEIGRYVSSIVRLAIDFPELNFVVRPHPCERSSFYTEAFSHFSNVFVDKSFDIRPFIRASKVVIHSECTTGLEAEISEKPNINYRPCLNLNEFSGLEVAGVSEIGTIVGTYGGLRDSLLNIVDSGYVFTKSSCDVSSYLLNFDKNVSSAEVIVKEILRFCNKNKIESTLSSLSSFRFLLGFSAQRTLSKIKFIMKKIWISLFLKKQIESGDTKMIFYPKHRVEALWKELGGQSRCLKVKNGVIYTYPD